MPKTRKLRRGPAVVLALAVCLLFALVWLLAVHMLRSSGGAVSPAASSRSSAAGSSAAGAASAASSSGASAQVLSAQAKTGGLLMLVNKQHLLPESYVPDFVTLPAKYYSSSDKDRRFDGRAAPYLEKFLDAARAAGYRIDIVSGYRSYAYQQANFDRHLKDFEAKGESAAQAKADAAKLVAPPGTSEHETGLAADIVTGDWYVKNKDLTADFDKTPAFKWMLAHCADYGFILRYPKGKETVTGYSYEPWHYRFVGVSSARAVMRKGECLEEYLAG